MVVMLPQPQTKSKSARWNLRGPPNQEMRKKSKSGSSSSNISIGWTMEWFRLNTSIYQNTFFLSFMCGGRPSRFCHVSFLINVNKEIRHKTSLPPRRWTICHAKRQRYRETMWGRNELGSRRNRDSQRKKWSRGVRVLGWPVCHLPSKVA